MSIQHNMTLKQPYFNLIREGKKTIELRLYDDKRRKIRVGDTIRFQNGDSFHTVEVKGLIISDSFKELFKFIDVQDTGLDNEKNAIEIMEQFYDKDAQKKFGVVGICIENID